MTEKDARARVAAADVLSGLYEAVADHTRLDGLLQGMDDFLEANADGLESGNADWKRMFREHFGRVGQFLDSDLGDHREAPIVFLERQVVPAATLNRNVDIVAANQLFVGMVNEEIQSLAGTFTTPADEKRFFDLCRANGSAVPALISFTLPEAHTPIFVVASKSPHLDLPAQMGPLITIKAAKATWNPDIVPLLESAYGLTHAEIEVLEGLVESGSVATVADQRERSVRTVRTQLTHIFSKLGLASQTELALFLATLTQLMTKERRPSEIGDDWIKTSGDEMTSHMAESDGQRLAYVKYGDPEGQPVLMLHSTTPPQMTPDFRAACRAAGLLMIGCHKPGAAGGTECPAKAGPYDLADSYRAVLDAEGIEAAIIAGHCSGGLYALAVAKAFRDRVDGVILVDTGVPLKKRSDLLSLPRSIRRTFIPARYMPEILLVPHRIFAANFKRSAAGEARVVDYFFQDSPADQALTRVDRKYYEITRQTIEYSFADIERLVADVCRWASDWSELLELPAGMPCAFVHGEANTMFSGDRIRHFVQTNSHFSLYSAEDKGQLQIYQDPSMFLQAINELFWRE